MIKTIVQEGNPVLRARAEKIDSTDITGPEIQSLIADMHATLATQYDGVALAAPQIGVSRRIFIVSPKVFKHPAEHELVYINPEIIKYSEKKKWMQEGCLSVRWKIGEVERSVEVTIRAYNDKGELFEQPLDGFLAHIIQHERDHLDGILFTDKARKLRDMTQKEIDEVTGGGR